MLSNDHKKLTFVCRAGISEVELALNMFELSFWNGLLYLAARSLTWRVANEMLLSSNNFDTFIWDRHIALWDILKICIANLLLLIGDKLQSWTKSLGKKVTLYDKIIPHSSVTMLKHKIVLLVTWKSPILKVGAGKNTGLQKALFLLTKTGAFCNLSNMAF